MFFLSDVSADFKRGRGKDKIKRKKKMGKGGTNKQNFDKGLEVVKTGQKIASTGTNISREARGWWRQLNRAKLMAEKLDFLKAAKAIKNSAKKGSP